ncbi:MAG: hypothetical protein JXA89_25950 [Anaerolineae bacterium]|nr:hypothetical protein [Anaerolineae bacterium]
MRMRQVLSTGWGIRQLETTHPDIMALTRAATQVASTWLPTTIPAQVHDALYAHGLIPDPHVGRNAAKSAWVGEKGWAYACTFTTPTGDGPVFLRFDGLDTLATLYINGEHVARFNNMHRHYAVEVRRFLHSSGGQNTLLLIFDSPLNSVAEAVERFGHQEGVPSHHYLRKCRSDFTSYLGARPHSVKVGVFGDVTLDIPDRAWLQDACIRSELSQDLSHATINVQFKTGGEPAQIEWRLVSPSRQQAARGTIDTSADHFDVALDDPQLWWPHTHGTPNLYTLHLDLVLDGERHDHQTICFGVRHIRPLLFDPQSGEKRFAFEINGQRIFLRGACWAPLEGSTHCWSQKRATRLLDLVEHGRMNVLRVWGGGTIPPQAFYDACDQRGILVWQDFMFGYGKYPSHLPAFSENCQAEIKDVVQRLRNHPCILLWCGGNENHMGWDFQFGTPPTEGWDLFDRMMPDICAMLDPDRLFHPSSPHGGPVPNWPLEGDWHDYTTLTFSPHASVPLFASEIGRVSAPSVSSLRHFLNDQELWPQGHDPGIHAPGQPAWPEMWQYRSVDGSWDKIGPIETFCDPQSPADLVRVLGTAHGEYLQRRIERQRRGMPNGIAGDNPSPGRRCWGNTVWRLNDPWPIIYWSVIDHYLEPKIAYYFLRRAYAPVLICFERAADRIAVWVVNDSPERTAGTLILRRMRFDGTVLGESSCAVELDPGLSRRCLDATSLGPVKLRDEFLSAFLGEQQATLLLAGERYLHLPQATLRAKHTKTGIEITGDMFVRQVTLTVPGTTGAVFEDNFFDLTPGQSRTIAVIDPAGGGQVHIWAVNAGPVQIDL